MILKNTNATYRLFSELAVGGEKSRFEIAGDCAFSKKDGQYYITYNDTEPDGEVVCTTTIEVDTDVVQVKRTGSVTTNLRYEVGRTYSSTYQFEYGAIVMETTTSEIEVSLTELGGTIEIKYLLDMGGTKSQNHLKIEIKTKEEAHA